MVYIGYVSVSKQLLNELQESWISCFHYVSREFLAYKSTRYWLNHLCTNIETSLSAYTRASTLDISPFLLFFSFFRVILRFQFNDVT